MAAFVSMTVMPRPMRSPLSGFARKARKPANVARIMGSRMPVRYVSGCRRTLSE